MLILILICFWAVMAGIPPPTLLVLRRTEFPAEPGLKPDTAMAPLRAQAGGAWSSFKPIESGRVRESASRCVVHAEVLLTPDASDRAMSAPKPFFNAPPSLEMAPPPRVRGLLGLSGGGVHPR